MRELYLIVGMVDDAIGLVKGVSAAMGQAGYKHGIVEEEYLAKVGGVHHQFKAEWEVAADYGDYEDGLQVNLIYRPIKLDLERRVGFSGFFGSKTMISGNYMLTIDGNYDLDASQLLNDPHVQEVYFQRRETGIENGFPETVTIYGTPCDVVPRSIYEKLLPLLPHSRSFGLNPMFNVLVENKN